MDVPLPPKPEEPLDSECCGTGCNPCVFDIYKRQLKKWEEDCEKIKESHSQVVPPSSSSTTENPHRLNPDRYELFQIVNIIPDAECTHIYRFNCIPFEGNSPAESLGSSFQVSIGQHVMIRVENVARKYTVLRLVNGTNGSNCFDILIKIYDKGCLTPLVARLEMNDQVAIRGPFGDPIDLKPNKYKNIVMLGAGTGIAPFYRIIERILDNEEDDTRIKLVFCNRSVKHVMLKTDLSRWSSFWNFHAIHFLSRNGKEAIPYGMEVRLKKFTFVDICEIGKDLQNCFYFICGTRSFEKDMVNYMRRMNVTQDFFHVF